jgi:hypothetical protein
MQRSESLQPGNVPKEGPAERLTDLCVEFGLKTSDAARAESECIEAV